MRRFAISDRPLDCAALKEELRNVACGAAVTFEGWVRNHNEGRMVTALEYEVYAPLAVKEGEIILAEAAERFGVDDLVAIHREGALDLEGVAVWVGVSSAHRAEAFEACRYVIDAVKQRLPIWKKETYQDGDSGWVNCERCADPQGHAHRHG